jgi:CheY-like chemotaxis protein
MDIRMPGMDGLEAIGHILKPKLRLPMIRYSAYHGYWYDSFATAADANVVKSSDLS